MRGLFQDVRYAVRQLRKSPGFTVVAVLTLALGIGASTSIFSVINAALLRYLPVSRPEQLVYFHLKNQPQRTSQTGFGDMSFTMPVFEAMRGRSDVLSDVVGFAPLSFQRVAVRIGENPEEALGEMVSGNFFSALGVQPFLGRGFTPQDEMAHAPVSVLNYSWWNRRFAANGNILGSTFYVKGVPITIVGVAPPGFNGVDPVHQAMDFWISPRSPSSSMETMPTSAVTLAWRTFVTTGNLWPSFQIRGSLISRGGNISHKRVCSRVAWVVCFAGLSLVEIRDMLLMVLLS